MVVDLAVADEEEVARGCLEGLPAARDVHYGEAPVPQPGVFPDARHALVVGAAVDEAGEHSGPHFEVHVTVLGHDAAHLIPSSSRPLTELRTPSSPRPGACQSCLRIVRRRAEVGRPYGALMAWPTP